jgi:hypothetical protein
VVQGAETGNEVEGVVGKGHVSTDIELDVFEVRILEAAGLFEYGYSPSATQDGPKFISIGTS